MRLILDVEESPRQVERRDGATAERLHSVLDHLADGPRVAQKQDDVRVARRGSNDPVDEPLHQWTPVGLDAFVHQVGCHSDLVTGDIPKRRDVCGDEAFVTHLVEQLLTKDFPLVLRSSYRSEVDWSLNRNWII